MNMQQWDKHQQHVDEHITWPATKQEIVDACQGSDVEAEVLAEIKTKLPEGDKKYSKQEFKNIVVM